MDEILTAFKNCCLGRDKPESAIELPPKLELKKQKTVRLALPSRLEKFEPEPEQVRLSSPMHSVTL